MTEQQQHPSSSNNVPLLDTFPEGQYLFETWLADSMREYRRAHNPAGDYLPFVSTSRERFLAQLVADKATRWAWDQREPEIQAAADAEKDEVAMPTPAPAGGLVERVRDAMLITQSIEEIARAAIREVADWLDSNKGLPDLATPKESDGWQMAADVLLKEASRG
jgi:hypothetical protein